MTDTVTEPQVLLKLADGEKLQYNEPCLPWFHHERIQ
jgi:hypothetical protein